MPRPDPGFPIKPSPPKYPPKTPPTDTTVPQYARAVIAMVDDVNKPTVATVYVDNSLPAEDGYKIPTSLGMKFVEAPNAWSSATAYNPGDLTELNGAAYQCLTANTNSQPPNANWTTPTGIAFYNNTATMQGGSWCDVDVYNKIISRIEQGESNGPPSNPSDLFQYIRHNGAYNTTGNFANPGPIDTTQLAIMPTNTTPNILSSQTPVLSATGSGTTDFSVQFTLDSLGTKSSTWLDSIVLAVSVTGANKWWQAGILAPNSSGTYTGVWGGVGSGNTKYDLAVVYKDICNGLSNAGIVVSNISANPLNSGLATLPVSAPTFTVTPANVVYTATSPTQYSVYVPFTSSAAPAAAAGVTVWYQVHGGPGTQYSLGILPISASNNYNVTIPSLPDSATTYDLYGAWIDANGDQGSQTQFFTSTAFTAPPAGSGGSMPSNTVASATFTSETAIDTWTNPYLIEVVFSLATAQTTALWASSVEMVYQPTNYSFLSSAASAGATTISVNWPLSGGLSAGNSITLKNLGGSPSESVTVSSIGTPTTSAYGTQTCVLTLSTALVNSYSVSSTVLGPGGSTWIPVGRLPMNSGGSYTGIWATPPSSTLAVRIIDYTGNSSGVSSPLYYVGTYRHALGTSPQSGASGSTPVVSSTSALNYVNAGNGAYDAQSTVTFDANGTTQNPWLSAVEYVVSTKNLTSTLNGAVAKGATSVTLTSASGAAVGDQLTLDTGSNIEYIEISGVSGNVLTLASAIQIAHNTGVATTVNTWNHYGYMPAQSKTAYALDWVSLGAGNIYQLGVRYMDQAGNTSYTVKVGTTAANPLTNTVLPAMPAGATISVSGVTETIFESGMHTLLANATGFAPVLEVSFTLGDTNNPAATTWGDHFVGYIRQNGTTSWASVPQTSVPSSSLTNGSTQTVRFHVTPGFSYDLAVLLADGQGNLTNSGTAVTLATNYAVPKVQSGSPVGPIWGWGHFLGDTSGDTTTIFVDGPNKRFLHSGMSAGVQGALNSTADTFGSYGKWGSLHRGHFDVAGQPGGTNLLYNPTFANGLTGWTASSGGTGSAAWSSNAYGGGHGYIAGTLDAGAFQIKQQLLSVSSSQQMVASGIISGDVVGTGVHIVVDVVDGSNTTTLGSCTITANQLATPFAFVFNTGSFTSVLFRCYAINVGASAGQSANASFYKLQLEYGTQPSPWVDHNSTRLVTLTHDSSGNLDLSRGQSGKLISYANTSAEYQGNFDSSGILKKSTTLISKIPNSASWVTDIVLSWNSTGNGPFTMNFWYDNGSGGDSTIWNPDGTVINIGHYTSTSPWKTISNVPGGSHVYVLMYWFGGAMQGSVGTSAPSQTTVNQAYADGGYVAFNATTQPSSVTGGGSGAKTGGGGTGKNFY